MPTIIFQVDSHQDDGLTAELDTKICCAGHSQTALPAGAKLWPFAHIESLGFGQIKPGSGKSQCVGVVGDSLDKNWIYRLRWQPRQRDVLLTKQGNSREA